MPNFLRQGICNQCGDCCGGNGQEPTSLGWEVVRTWSLDDVSESYNLWTLFGLGNVGDEIAPISPSGLYRVGGKPYYFAWVEHVTGRGHIPCKDISPAHDGSVYSVECPFLKDDPGDGSRPCALVGSKDDGARFQFCRPEERAEPPPNYDVWDERSTLQWQADHPNCTYTVEEIIP